MNNIEELKKVALAATPGPWERCDSYGPNENGTCISAVERPDLMIASTTDYYGRVGGIANTHFIALANPAVILDLIAQLEAAQKERDAFKQQITSLFERVSGESVIDYPDDAINWLADMIEGELDANSSALSAANEKPKPISFDELADRVQFVTGGIRMSFDPLNCKGHQIVPFMNFNSLLRIVEMYRTTETYNLAGFAVEGNADVE
ncbi:ead/Ea22-like family protein [Yersinia enterocolitica]